MKGALMIGSLHDCFIFVMKQLTECALEELLYKVYGKRSLWLHLTVASYVADLPESEVLLSVKEYIKRLCLATCSKPVEKILRALQQHSGDANPR